MRVLGNRSYSCFLSRLEIIAYYFLCGGDRKLDAYAENRFKKLRSLMMVLFQQKSIHYPPFCVLSISLNCSGASRFFLMLSEVHRISFGNLL